MTIHTFEVSCIVSKERYFLIQDKLKNTDPAKWAKEKFGMTYWGLSDKGIIIRMFIIKKKFNLKSIRDFMISAKIIGDDLFRYYLSKICNDGKICTLSEALKRIDMGEYHPQNKEILKKFIEISNRFRSAAKAIILYKEFCDRKEINRMIWMLSNIDISFVTATNEVAKLFDRGYIPTPLELHEDWCC